jgi:hypothetical protein
MSNTDSAKGTFDDDNTSQGIDATISNHGENASTSVEDHGSDNGLTMIATAASQADTAVGLLSTAANLQSVNAVTVETTDSAATDASREHEAVHPLTRTTSLTAGSLQSEAGEEKLEQSLAAVSSLAAGDPQNLSCNMPISSWTYRTDAYRFTGLLELQKLQSDGKHSLRGVVQRFKTIRRVGVFETQLERFKSWGTDLRMWRFLDSSEGDNSKWLYHIVIIEPRATVFRVDKMKNAESTAKLEFFTALAKKFYLTNFEANEENTYKIGLSLNRDTTVMLLASKVGGKDLPKSTFYLRKNIHVVSAASYRCVCPDEADEDFKPSGSRSPAMASKSVSLEDANKETSDDADADKEIDVMLTWLAVSDRTHPMPSIAASWRRQGIGQFMFILIIKQCAAFLDGVNIEIFLQCHEAGAFRFYCMLGFQRLNSNHDDGFTLLPKKLQDVLFAVPPNKKKGGRRQSTFSFWGDDPEQIGQSATKLMHLRHQQLRSMIEIDDDASLVLSGATNERLQLDENVHIPLKAMWCQYPPPSFGSKGTRLSYSISLIEKLLKGLPHIQELLPPTYANPVPATSLPVKGHISILRRIIHSHSDGTTWMSSSEMDLMVATLMLDGRYEDSAFVVPFSICEGISIAYGSYVAYKKWLGQAATLRAILDNGSRSSDEVNAVVRETLGHEVANALSNYNNHMSNLLVKVVSRNPGLLERRIIVFPFCEGSYHWSATFVFNADSIFESKEQTNSSSNTGTVLRPCFFRYCSLRNDGTRKVSLDQGVIWFLNLCASYEIHMKSNLGSQRISFIEPFGSNTEGDMLGTDFFPALRVTEDGYFPLQKDGYNCGVGVCATIGILFRELLPRNEDFLFDDLFSRANMPTYRCESSGEVFCHMPVSIMTKLPGHDDAIGSKKKKEKDYLSTVREQWFTLFDRMAEFQFVGGPYMLDKKNEPDIAYVSTMDLLSWPRGKKRIISKETKEKAALVLRLAEQTHTTNQRFVMVGSVVDLTTPSKMTRAQREELVMDITTPSAQVQGSDPNNESDFDLTTPSKMTRARREELVMNITTPSAHVQESETNNESDFLSQDTDDEQEFQDANSSNVDGAKDESAFHFKSEDKKPEIGVVGDISSQARFAFVTQSQVNASPVAEDVAVHTAIEVINQLGDDVTAEIRDVHGAIEVPNELGDNIMGENQDENHDIHARIEVNNDLGEKQDATRASDETSAVSLPHHETAADDPDKVTVKYLKSFDPKRLRIPKRPSEAKVDWIKRLRLDSDDNDILKSLTENQKKRARSARKKQVEEEEKIDLMEAEYEASLRKKICTQSLKSIKTFQEKYRTNLEEEEPMVKRDAEYERELQQFISNSFEAWGWDSEEKHKNLISTWVAQLQNPDNTEKEQQWIRTLIKALKDERATFKKKLTKEFMFTRRSMVKGLKYVSTTNTFKARLVFYDVDPDNNDNFIEQEEEMQVDEAWVRDEFSEEDVQHIINMRLDNTWIQAPRDIEVRIGKEKIVRVRYTGPRQMRVVDNEAMTKYLREKQNRRSSRARAIRLAYKKKTGKTFKGTILDEEEDDEEVPRRTINIKEKWVGRMNNGKETDLDETFVRKNFGDAFANELKSSKRGFVDVPVGDFKHSHLHLHPHLEVPGAPTVRFTQKDGKDLCVSKSLASALHSLGFENEAAQIDFYGEEILKGAVVDALDCVMLRAKNILPKWIVIERIPKNFDWQKDLLDERHILVGVLLASDGNCSHAVTIHGGFVYDANEVVALPLCQEALDYCTSIAEVKSSFVRFRRGYFLRYKGTKKHKLDLMTLA